MTKETQTTEQKRKAYIGLTFVFDILWRTWATAAILWLVYHHD